MLPNPTLPSATEVASSANALEVVVESSSPSSSRHHASGRAITIDMISSAIDQSSRGSTHQKTMSKLTHLRLNGLQIGVISELRSMPKLVRLHACIWWSPALTRL
jgi:hypothetical protein